MTRRRPIVRAAAAVMLMLGLSGCVRIDAEVEIGPDDTISGSFIRAVNTDSVLGDGLLAGLSDGTVSQVEATKARLRSLAGQVIAAERATLPLSATARSYEDRSWIGDQVEFSGVTFEEFPALVNTILRAHAGVSANTALGQVRDEAVQSPDARPLTGSITRDGDRILVSLNLAGSSRTASLNMATASTFAVSFPGRVISANTRNISGNTVTWTFKAGDPVSMVAEGETSRRIWTPTLLLTIATWAAALYFGWSFVDARGREEVPAHQVSGNAQRPGVLDPRALPVADPAARRGRRRRGSR